MNEKKRPVGRPKKKKSKREERANRILDATAELILRWGYDKTTVDDIAQKAGVAKGTIYLHWKTRDELFTALIQRESDELGQDFRRRVSADPAGATLRGIYRHAALALMKRPLLKAFILLDKEVVGKLAASTQGTAAYADRLAGFNVYLDFLRKRGLVRSDISVPAQIYTVTAIFMGFFLIQPLLPDELQLSDEKVADLIGESIHRTLEADRSLSPEDQQEISRQFLPYLDRILANTANPIQRS